MSKVIHTFSSTNSIAFYSLVEKVTECEKAFGNKTTCPLERPCALLKNGRINHMILLEEQEVKEEVEEIVSETWG
jgi:hypothetical protein